MVAMNVHSLFADLVMNMKEEKEINLALNARLDLSELKVTIMQSCGQFRVVLIVFCCVKRGIVNWFMNFRESKS